MKRTFFKVTLSAMILLSVHVNSNAQPKMEQVQPETGRQMTSKSAGANANLKKEMTSKGLGVNANLPEESKDLMKFSGRWNGDITIIKDGKSHKVNYSMIGRVIAGGKGMYIEEAFSDSVLGDMKGANLVGYSKEDSKVHWYSIDGDGVPHDHVGVWKAPDSLSISHSGMRKGSSYSEKIEFSRI